MDSNNYLGSDSVCRPLHFFKIQTTRSYFVIITNVDLQRLLHLGYVKFNGVLASGWYKSPLSYMIYSAYYAPPPFREGGAVFSKETILLLFNLFCHFSAKKSVDLNIWNLDWFQTYDLF